VGGTLTRSYDTGGRRTSMTVTGQPAVSHHNANRCTLNNIVEQDNRTIKRITKPMLNFNTIPAVRRVLAGIELMHMIRKGQLKMATG